METMGRLICLNVELPDSAASGYGFGDLLEALLDCTD